MIRKWRKTYKYRDEPGAPEMVRLMVFTVIDKAKEDGKLVRVIGEPAFITVPDEVEGYFKVIVSFEFVEGMNLRPEKANEKKFKLLKN